MSTMRTTLLEEALTWLRHSDDGVFDEEVADEIEACKADLKKRGVDVISEDNPLVRKAVKLYVKAGFGFSADQNKYMDMYESLANSMASSNLYKEDGDG